ncbi:hypothetical protein SAMN05443572_107357 [Myxococcus fulvus]|uniref:Lipoprotein n=1 Tax=Myxococcus fulvus TaxID=33 RepID=A0A511TG81_MYXFU|nr:hypothetical protein [Myxococcus fulvus]AKF86076.1 hypothetical protein MFUL124B02_21210 [Myxococcus fulvus 124B02]GEN12198.1 hypothetical protein MFU01_72350 [Myxococcus fulvus]SEU26976.1 hypothetical protein SAMN05443572_107357 [Myxococcus fulvus]
MRLARLLFLVLVCPVAAMAQGVPVVFTYEGSGFDIYFASATSRSQSELEAARRVAGELARFGRYWRFDETTTSPSGNFIHGHIEAKGNLYHLVLDVYRGKNFAHTLWRCLLYEPQTIVLRGVPAVANIPRDVGACLNKDFPRDIKKLKDVLKESFMLTSEADLRSPPRGLLRLAWPSYCSLAGSTFRITGAPPQGAQVKISSLGTWRIGRWSAPSEEVLTVEHLKMNGQKLRAEHYSNIRQLKSVQIWLDSIEDEGIPCDLQVAK